MTVPAPLLAIVLLALLVGAAIPVLYQLYQMLKRARALLDTAGPRFEDALDQVGRAADRLNGMGSTLEAQAQTLRPLFDAAARLRHSIDRPEEWFRTAMSLGGAVAPAVIAGLRAFFTAPRSGRESRERPRSSAFNLKQPVERVPGEIRRAGAKAVEASQAASGHVRGEAS